MNTSVCIIGAGPAGISAAIQLKRYDVPFVIFERNKSGGLLNNANYVDNYPGFPEGIKGSSLCALLDEQVKNNRIDIIFDLFK